MQGKTLRPIFENKSARWRDYIVSEVGEHPKDACLTLRSAAHKIVQYKENGRRLYEQFFDLERDPWEMSNEIGNRAFVYEIQRLRSELQDWEESTPVAEGLR